MKRFGLPLCKDIICMFICRLMFEMLSCWPERNTFKSLKPIDFPLYKEMIKDPIALDPIMERLDINNSEQVKDS